MVYLCQHSLRHHKPNILRATGEYASIEWSPLSDDCCRREFRSGVVNEPMSVSKDSLLKHVDRVV